MLKAQDKDLKPPTKKEQALSNANLRVAHFFFYIVLGATMLF